MKWRRLTAGGGVHYYRSSDDRWQINRHVEITWRRAPIGDDNAEEATTEWATLADAQHLGADLEAAYPPPPKPAWWETRPRYRIDDATRMRRTRARARAQADYAERWHVRALKPPPKAGEP